MTLAVTADARLKSWLRVSVWVLESGLLCVATQPPRVRALVDRGHSVSSQCYLKVLLFKVVFFKGLFFKALAKNKTRQNKTRQNKTRQNKTRRNRIRQNIKSSILSSSILSSLIFV